MEREHTFFGRVLGAILLVTGCCIGAGMLGLPIVAGLSGFIPSTVAFVLVWMFMLATGLLVLEVNLWFKKDASFLTMAERTLGPVGKWISGFLFLFLFYSLMVAYIAGGGALLCELMQQYLGIQCSGKAGSLFAAFGLGIVILPGTGVVDMVNRVFMVGLVVAYISLLVIGLPYIDTRLLCCANWSAIFVAIPVMVISFGYHNLIPSLTEYLEHNKREVVKSIVIGSSLPLLVYLLWDGLILGIIPEGYAEAMASGNMATQALRTVSEAGMVSNVAEIFAFFALVTSFLGVALSLVDFLRDGFHDAGVGLHRLLFVALAVVPPLIFALIYPTVFLLALGYAGGFATVILFGILPALMAWRGRYILKLEGTPILPGGKFSLILIILVSCLVVVSQILTMEVI